MSASINDVFPKVGSPGSATFLASPGHSIAGTTFNVDSTSLWPTDTAVVFSVDTTSIVNGEATRDVGSYTVWRGIVTSATAITSCVLMYGTDQDYSAGSTTRVYIEPTTSRENRIVDGLLVEHTNTGAHATTLVTSRTEDTAPDIASDFLLTYDTSAAALKKVKPSNLGLTSGWLSSVLAAPNTVTALGNRSYSMVFNSVDYSATLSAGMRLRTTRTVAAPTQSTSLNGTTQYYSKSSPAGMTFTDTPTCMGWIKLTSYADGVIIGRKATGTAAGWEFKVNSSGQLVLRAGNTAANLDDVTSYQSVPLNKWVHVAAALTMSTAGSSKILIDGVAVPTVFTNGTSTTITQAGNFIVGATNTPDSFFPGKIAQVAVFSAIISDANILSYMSQGLAGTETSLVSAYSFNNAITDLNTTNANNLTANGSAVATNADSPFGGQADGTISSTLDYAIIQKVAFSTNTTVTVQVPEGCTIPTSGGVSSVVYSSNKAPYGMPVQREKWFVDVLLKAAISTSGTSTNTWYNPGGIYLNTPIGAWSLGYSGLIYVAKTNATGTQTVTLGTTAAAETDNEITSGAFQNYTGDVGSFLVKVKNISLSSATNYFLNLGVFGGTFSTLQVFPSTVPFTIRAENAYL